MLAKLKQKLEQKKSRNKAIAESQHWKQNALLRDCLQAMRGSCTVAPMELHEAVIAVVNIALREDHWTELEELIDIPADFLTGTVYIVWDEAKLPVLKAPWDMAGENLTDIRAVAFETFLVSETMDRIIHFGDRGGIRLYDVT